MLTSSRVYLRTGSGFGAFASPPPFLLFDYDNLPDNIIVPNGGLRSLPSTLSSAASPTTTANKIDNRLARRFDELARDDGGQWSELAESPPFTFSGIMFRAFLQIGSPRRSHSQPPTCTQTLSSGGPRRRGRRRRPSGRISTTSR